MKWISSIDKWSLSVKVQKMINLWKLCPQHTRILNMGVCDVSNWLIWWNLHILLFSNMNEALLKYGNFCETNFCSERQSIDGSYWFECVWLLATWYTTMNRFITNYHHHIDLFKLSLCTEFQDIDQIHTHISIHIA